MFPGRGGIEEMSGKGLARWSLAPLLAAVAVASGVEAGAEDTAAPSPVLGDPPGCASVTVLGEQTIVRRAPDGKSRRRGVAMRGARLPALGRIAGPGCSDYWYRVYDGGWICGLSLAPSADPPAAARYPIVPDGALTPWPYAFVREQTIEYELIGGMLQEVRELLEGFGFGVQGSVSAEGQAFLKTAEGNLVPRGAAGITSRLSELAGIEIAGGKPWPVGWLNAKRAWAYDAPSRDKKHRVAPASRYQAFEVIELQGKGRKGFVRFDEGGWFSLTDVRIAEPAPRPESVRPDEKWVDVDVAQQVVTAYVGDAPVYATLASTGRAGPSKTVLGEYRIWAKIAAIAMDNTEETVEAIEASQLADAGAPVEDVKLFSLHDVPWTQFFFESYALHGVYWHDRFGNRRSHGCVNLSPRDARWFYDFTEPHVPDGWWAIHTASPEEGTLVRIR
jgi:hypothetical protein